MVFDKNKKKKLHVLANVKKSFNAIQILRREVKKKMYVKIFNLYDASHF
jgi:hypothetical protein